MAQNGSTSLSTRILKAMTLFGGVKVISILCSVIRTKFVALWLGPAGIGLFGLYNNVVDMISTFCNFGMRDSCVRNIASAQSNFAIAVIVKVVRRWSMMLGAFGALLTLCLSPILSKATFGDSNHIWGFVALAVVFLFNSLTLGEEAVLQGTAKLRLLARASICGVVAGMLVSIPMFYIWRLDSVVPSIIAYHITTASFMLLWRNKDFKDVQVDISLRDTAKKGTGFIRLGTFMMLSSFVTILCGYIFRSYLNLHFSTNDVGLFQAGFSLVSQYTGIIFAAMGMEYYPRLAKTIHSNHRTSLFVSEQINLLILMLIPIMAIFIAASEFVIKLLYTDDFLNISPYITIAMLGIVFRALSWSMAFTILAKGDGKTFLITECSSAAVGLALKMALFKSLGFAGLGIAFTIWYIIYFLIIICVYRRKYGLRLHPSSLYLSAAALTSTTAMLAAHYYNAIVVEIAVITACSIFCAMKIKRQISR